VLALPGLRGERELHAPDEGHRPGYRLTQVLDRPAVRLLERVERRIRIFACRGEDHPDHRLAGLDHGIVAVLQHLDLLHCPVAALPVQLCFGPSLEAFLLFLLHDQLLDCLSNQRNSIY
jgi:hypothetical protein